MPSPSKTSKSKGAPNRTKERDLLPLAVQVYQDSATAGDLLKPTMSVLERETIEDEGRRIAHIVKSRIKSAEDVVEKVKRKRRGAKRGSKNYAYEPHHVTDGCGFRVVVLFQDDILKVTENVIKMLKHMSPYTDNPICKLEGLLEAVVYTNRPPDEEGSVHVRVVEMLKDAGFTAETKPPENRKGGYSSVHFVVAVHCAPPTSSGRRGTGVGGPSPVRVPVEIQVRDIFEEAWCEIDHTLRYVNDRDGLLEGSMAMTWKPHLAALKTFADGCSQHASLIKQNAIEHAKNMAKAAEGPERSQPSEPPVSMAVLLRQALPEDLHALVDNALTTFELAQDVNDDTLRAASFTEAADLFGELLKRIGDQGRRELAGRDIAYRLKMERAFCLQALDDNKGLAEAKQIYSDVLAQWPNDAFAIYRLATLLRRSGDLPASRSLYEKGCAALSNDSTIDAKSWLRSAMPRHLGLTLWNMAEDDALNLETRLALLQNAVHATEIALVAGERNDLSRPEIAKCLNNLCYYQMRIAELAQPTPPGAVQSIRDLAERLENEIPRNGVLSPYLLELHTLMLAWRYLHEEAAMRRTCSALSRGLYEMARGRARLPQLPPHEIKSYLPNNLLDVYDDVVRILFGD